jgi:hypothetical protein
MYLNPNRPIDATVAQTGNGSHLRRMANRAHVGASLLEVCRQVRQGFRPGAMLNFQPEVRRAIWKIVADQHVANRDLYRRVILGR